MQIFRIEVFPVQKSNNSKLLTAAHQLGINGLTTCFETRLFFLQGDITLDEVDQLTTRLLVDPVTETYHIGASVPTDGAFLIETTLHPGVTDPVAENLLRAAHLLGIDNLSAVATGHRFEIAGNLTPDEVHQMAVEVLSNPVIQHYVEGRTIDAPFIPTDSADDTVETITIRDLSDEGLIALSQERRLSLDLNEMKAIRDYFQEIQREATDAELEMLAQTWSEHCVHKTFKANVTYTGPAHGAPADSEPITQQVNSIIKSYLRAATDKVNKPWVRSAFVDNAGIVKFDEKWDIAFKAETHNRPSAIEPFGGANTGAGGVIRDVLGVSARPIANTDILCFGPPDLSHDELPQGVLHPTRIADGVIAGIEDYGNKMGIPTVNGSVIYHRGYTSNPLVFAGCVGILPHGTHRTTAQDGDLVVVIGGRTGRDGLRGATFSSMEMDTTTAKVSGGAVQIGHPINEKQVMEVVLRARDEELYTAITDCGAGGLSSAVGEMGAELGATVQLQDIPLKYPGLRPWEIWLSEAQERLVFAVPPENWERFKQICAGQDVEAVAIGTYEATGQLTLYYGDQIVGDLSMEFLHDGIPTRNMVAEWSAPKFDTQPNYEEEEHHETLLGLLAMPTIRSKEDVVRRYDHEVQTGTAVKPLVGSAHYGPGDATVIVPMDTINKDADTVRGVSLSNGVCPTYTELDPYAMAWAAVDEAMRNLVSVGTDPDQVSILDNFSWGNTQLPDRMGALVRCTQGCYDAAVAYGVPFISGKDSLNNEYLGADGQRHAIPGTLVISGMGIVPDVNKTVTMDAKREGNALYLIGETRAELGGSHYHLLKGYQGGTVPQPNQDALETLRTLYNAIKDGLITSCHDLSEGGLAVALSEICLAGGVGAEVHLPEGIDAITALYAESLTRFIVEITPENSQAFEARFPSAQKLGALDDSDGIEISQGDTSLINLALFEIEQAFRGHLRAIDFAVEKPQSTPETSTQKTFSASVKTTKPKVLILHANGTNRDRDAVLACQLAGGEPEIVHINQLIAGERHLLDYQMLVVPGGFSYGDDLGAGVLWSLDLRERIGDIQQFVDEGRPVLGICNGFQTLVKSGLLPGHSGDRDVTLTYNAHGDFECRWVYLKTNPNSPSLFTQGTQDELIHCPVAHGEGRIAFKDQATAERYWSNGLAALTYVDMLGTAREYPFNPNGSTFNIAGLTNEAGNVFGLMPHPENHIYPWQHPNRHRGESGMSGLILFENGIRFA